MHSRIIQLSEEKINEKDYIREGMFFENFVGDVADYVTDDITDVEEEYKDIFSDSEAFDLDLDNRTVTIKDKKKYFEGFYQCWRKGLEELLAEATLEKFCNLDIDIPVYRTNSLYEDKFDIYISDSDGNYETFNTWLRLHKDGDKFYLGKVLDYHY